MIFKNRKSTYRYKGYRIKLGPSSPRTARAVGRYSACIDRTFLGIPGFSYEFLWGSDLLQLCNDAELLVDDLIEQRASDRKELDDFTKSDPRFR